MGFTCFVFVIECLVLMVACLRFVGWFVSLLLGCGSIVLLTVVWVGFVVGCCLFPGIWLF